VAPSLRGRGTGARLVAAARREAMARGWRSLEATVPDAARFPAAKGFLAANGFVPAGARLRVLLA
jgi:GNAT superfamily N-acetyltransferase